MTELEKYQDDYLNLQEEKERACKKVNYKCKVCDYYCHCSKTNDEFHCMYECDSILCPLI